jgi:glycosyltransferase involved in cell wall biosynthesis
MTSLPRISIVTPSYNQAAFLEATIRSVLNQDYPNLEYIIVDGGSTDNSMDIIRKYESDLAWWVSEKDHGQAEAINKGFNRVTGEIIAWINSDDIYLGKAFERAVAVFLKHPEAGIVYGDVLAIDGEGKSINTMRYGDWGLEDLMCFSIIGQPGVFMRHSYLEKVRQNGLYLDQQYHYMLDHQLWIRMAMLAPMVHIPELIAAGRYHAEAKNIAQAARFGQEAYTVLAWMQSNPELAGRCAKISNRIWAGAHRYNARYLLDGNQPGPALKSYWKSFLAHPRTALVEWHRMVFAVLSVLGLGGLKKVFFRLRHFIHMKKEPQLYG